MAHKAFLCLPNSICYTLPSSLGPSHDVCFVPWGRAKHTATQGLSSLLSPLLRARPPGLFIIYPLISCQSLLKCHLLKAAFLAHPSDCSLSYSWYSYCALVFFKVTPPPKHRYSVCKFIAFRARSLLIIAVSTGPSEHLACDNYLIYACGEN